MKKIKVAIMQEDAESLMQIKQEEMEGTTGICFTLKEREKPDGVLSDVTVMGEMSSLVLAAFANAVSDVVKDIVSGRKEEDELKQVFMATLLRAWTDK